MKPSTKTIVIGVIVTILAIIVASWIVNIALTFLAAIFKFLLVLFVAAVLIVIFWIWWARARRRD